MADEKKPATTLQEVEAQIEKTQAELDRLRQEMKRLAEIRNGLVVAEERARKMAGLKDEDLTALGIGDDVKERVAEIRKEKAGRTAGEKNPPAQTLKAEPIKVKSEGKK